MKRAIRLMLVALLLLSTVVTAEPINPIGNSIAGAAIVK